MTRPQLRGFLASRFLLAVITVVPSSVCRAQNVAADRTSSGSAWGRVLRSGDDRPLRHARVEFFLPSSGWASSALADSEGKFDFPGLANGTYQVNVSMPGYERLESTASVEGAVGPLVLRLRKIETLGTPVNDSVVSVQELRSSGKAQKFFEKGTKLLLNGDAAGSIRYFDRAIAKDPYNYRAHYDKGLAQFRLGHAEEAEQAFPRTIDLTGGGFAPADFLTGILLCQKLQFRQAEIIIQRGLDVDPGSGLGRIALGWVQFALNHLNDAERSAQQAAMFRRGNLPEAYFLLAQIHFRQHKLYSTVADLESYLRLDPDGQESAEAKSLLEATRHEMEPSPAGPSPANLP